MEVSRRGWTGISVTILHPGTWGPFQLYDFMVLYGSCSLGSLCPISSLDWASYILSPPLWPSCRGYYRSCRNTVCHNKVWTWAHKEEWGYRHINCSSHKEWNTTEFKLVWNKKKLNEMFRFKNLSIFHFDQKRGKTFWQSLFGFFSLPEKCQYFDLLQSFGTKIEVEMLGFPMRQKFWFLIVVYWLLVIVSRGKSRLKQLAELLLHEMQGTVVA